MLNFYLVKKRSLSGSIKEQLQCVAVNCFGKCSHVFFVSDRRDDLEDLPKIEIRICIETSTTFCDHV